MGVDLPLVDVMLEDDRWRSIGIETLADRAARAALLAAGRDPEGCEISVLFADDRRIAALNAEFRGKVAPTNVLSWPTNSDNTSSVSGERTFLGDIALAWETCAREADEAGISQADHIAHLLVHGVLHLLGHDHEKDDAAEEMEALERKALATLGVPDPYG